MIFNLITVLVKYSNELIFLIVISFTLNYEKLIFILTSYLFTYIYIYMLYFI